MAAHAEFVRSLRTSDSDPGGAQIDYEAVSARFFAGNNLVGATIAEGPE